MFLMHNYVYSALILFHFSKEQVHNVKVPHSKKVPQCIPVQAVLASLWSPHVTFMCMFLFASSSSLKSVCVSVAVPVLQEMDGWFKYR